MKLPERIQSLHQEDGSFKQLLPHLCSTNTFKRFFPKQALPALSLFANKSTQIVLYLLANTDSHNLIYATYADIEAGCDTKDRTMISNVLATLQDAQVITKVATSTYMLNPAVMMQGSDQKYGLLSKEFTGYVNENEKKKEKKDKEK